MTAFRAYVSGLGLLGPAGRGAEATLCSLRKIRSTIGPLSLFSFGAEDHPLPAGEIREVLTPPEGVPRTHHLALLAAREAMGRSVAPDVVVLGGTTGGMPLTEELLKHQITDPGRYCFHGTGTVAEYVAKEIGCSGPALTVSTACSSGAVALKIALELIRNGQAKRVLAGGVDGLCRLTYYGFYLLQLIDPQGARPLDRNRLGMTVGEGAGMLLLEAGETPPQNAMAELLGGGLSCDAYHATKPHPEGQGALAAMKAALADAGLAAEEIGYINLHGTGTKDNDASEANAIRQLFSLKMPPVSSTKGLAGHPLAASGAMEAGYACLSLQHGFLPANVGCQEPDPALGITPILEPLAVNPKAVLSNSFGFGGNNAALILAEPRKRETSPALPRPRITIKGVACLTGAGHGDETYQALQSSGSCCGKADLTTISRDLPARQVRRLGRLSQMALALAVAAHKDSGCSSAPGAVFMGTGWGGLSETHDFLMKLYETGEKLSSPIDFVGSVHNAPAGQIALWFKAQGANVTATGGDASFEQALWMASLLGPKEKTPVILVGADEAHPVMTPLLDPACCAHASTSDGGAAFLLDFDSTEGPCFEPLFFGVNTEANWEAMMAAIMAGGALSSRYGAVFFGEPANNNNKLGAARLRAELKKISFAEPVVAYRPKLGEFAGASALAAWAALRFLRDGALLPAFASDVDEHRLCGRGILLLNLGKTLTALAVHP